MILENMIEITGVDLVKLTQVAYKLSHPQGLGFLHFEEGDLSKEEAQEHVDNWKNDTRMALGLDYVRGRACKLTVFKEKGKLFIRKRWFDHSEKDLKVLLKEINIDT